MFKFVILTAGVILTVGAFANQCPSHGLICAALTGLLGFVLPTGGEEE